MYLSDRGEIITAIVYSKKIRDMVEKRKASTETQAKGPKSAKKSKVLNLHSSSESLDAQTACAESRGRLPVRHTDHLPLGFRTSLSDAKAYGQPAIEDERSEQMPSSWIF